MGRLVEWRWALGIVLSSLLSAGVAHAYPEVSAPPFVEVVLANDPAAIAGYALVPQDAPVLLPLKIGRDPSWNAPLPAGTVLDTIPLTLDGDPTGAATAFSEHDRVSAEVTWTPGGDRELGRPYVATLVHGSAVLSPERAVLVFTSSSFLFSYIEGTSADFLPEVDLTLSDASESYTNKSGCCEVDAALCAEATSCFQCWDRVGALYMTAVWTGPGFPYLTLQTEPEGWVQVEEFGEVCARGTASAGDERRSFSVCRTVSEWPSVEVEGRETVFADTCRFMPEGYSPLTRLFVVRGETEAQALRRLSGSPPDSDPVSRCGLGSRPGEGSALPWLAVLAVLGAAGRRRLSSCRNPGR